jgi:hypothetical protein
MDPGERFWWSRLRWRLRGATQWPAFVVLTLLDGLVLDRLPPVATLGLNFIEGVLIATFANLFLIGALAPFLTRRLAARQQAPAPSRVPPEAQHAVRQDRVATLLLVAGLAATIVSGLANRPLIVSETQETEEAARALLDVANNSPDAELRRNLETANTVRLGEGYFRICIARDDRERFACFFIDTQKEPTEVRRDPSVEPNDEVAG